jgi:hypothetical protein
MSSTATLLTNYQTISDVIEHHPTKAISVNYNQDPASVTRLLWPHVLGMSRNPKAGGPDVEMVLCYQYDDGQSPTQVVIPHVSRANYRCFPVASFTTIAVITFSSTAPPPGWHPELFKYKHVRKQNCVDDPDVFR